MRNLLRSSTDPSVSAALGDFRRTFWSVAAFSAVVNILMFASPLYMMQVYDRVLSGRSIPDACGPHNHSCRRAELPSAHRIDPISYCGARSRTTRSASRGPGTQGDDAARRFASPRG